MVIEGQVRTLLTQPKRTVFLDPSYQVFNEDRLFGDPALNRDNCLAPFVRLKRYLESHNIEVHTADYFVSHNASSAISDYYSFGILNNYRDLHLRPNVNLKAFIISEPPVIAPEHYSALRELTIIFERVYVHNTHGDGYSLDGVDQTRLRKLYIPQPYNDVIDTYWSNTDRQRRIVMINGNHCPRSRSGELYSKRIEAAVALAKSHAIDLYGRGWERWWSRSSMWLPYWRNRRSLMAIYHGSCKSKYEVLSRYQFSLCFENMAMDGYISEKIFDCFYAGTVPLYMGARNVSSYIPTESYVDCSLFSSWEETWSFVKSLTNEQIDKMREAGRAFLSSQEGLKFHDSLLQIIDL